MIDPQIAHHIDARALRASVPHLPQADLSDIRRAFAQFISANRARTPQTTWQHAWNAFTGATPHRPGTLTYRTSRCPECHGKGFTTRNISRNLSRTGNPYACGECRGTRRGKMVSKPAIYITPPQPTEGDPA